MALRCRATSRSLQDGEVLRIRSSRLASAGRRSRLGFNVRQHALPDIRIEICDAPTPTVVHRFRNFGEDVYRAFRDQYTVELAEIDADTSHFHVRGIRRRALRTVIREIDRLVAAHHFTSSASIVVLEDVALYLTDDPRKW